MYIPKNNFNRTNRNDSSILPLTGEMLQVIKFCNFAKNFQKYITVCKPLINIALIT